MVKKKPVEEHKIPIRLHLDRASIGALNRWAGRDEESVSNVVRGLIRREIGRERDSLKIGDRLVGEIESLTKDLKEVTAFETPEAPKFTVDQKLEKALKNSPVLVTANLLREFRYKDDTDGLPRISLPSGNVGIVWSKLLPILEYCLIEKNVAAFFYDEETRFELVGGKLGAELHWWEKTAETELTKRTNLRDYGPLKPRRASKTDHEAVPRPLHNVRPTVAKFVIDPEPVSKGQ